MPTALNTNFDYTYNGILNLDFMNRPTVGVPALSEMFDIRQGIRYKEQLHLPQTLSKIVKKYLSCARTFVGNTDIINRTIEVTNMELNLEFCTDDFDATVMSELTNLGIDRNNISGTEIQRIIDALIMDAMARDNFRVLCWGDSSDGDDDYNQFDGLYTRLVAGTTLVDAQDSDYCVQKIDDITTLNQTSGTRAIDYFRNLYEQAKNVLKQIPATQKCIWVTPNLWENYLTFLETAGESGAEGGFRLVQDGQMRLFFRGIEVKQVLSWADHLADAENPYNGTIDTFALYTTPMNHVIGTPRLSDTDRVDGWYERKDKKYYFEGQYGLGYNYIHCDLQVFSSGDV